MSTYQYSCDECAFQVRSEHDEELIELVQEHSNDYHDRSVPENNIRAEWEQTGSTDN